MKSHKSALMSKSLSEVQEEVVQMKDYEIEELENDYGSMLEEVLAEIFKITEDDSLLDERLIYDLSNDEDIERRLAGEADWLSEGSADIEDLSLLEAQARKYFESPNYVAAKEDEDPVDWITGFIQINSGVRFDGTGVPVEIWKSFSQKLICEPQTILSPEKIIKEVELLGVEWNEMVRVVFYGRSLEQLIGSRIYSKGEAKELVSLSPEFNQILLAIPSCEECDSEESIFSAIENIINESIQLGGELGLERVSLGHYELTLSRLEELQYEAIEVAENERIAKYQKSSVDKRNSYDARFKEARAMIHALNEGKLRIGQLLNTDTKLLGQVMYLCQKKGERIKSPALFFQLKALTVKKRCEGIQGDSGTSLGMDLIAKVNSGELIEVHLLGEEVIEEVFKILWSGLGVRINVEYKETYFALKERFNHLQRCKKNAA